MNGGSSTPISQFIPFLSLLFIGTVCNSMIVPFMGFYIVNELGREPWTIGVYATGVAFLGVLSNRYFAVRIDSGVTFFALIGIAVGGYILGSIALVLNPSFGTVLTFGVIGFGISTSAISTMFSLGGCLAEQQSLDRKRMNAYMRATTSTAWMIGPAFSFFVSARYGGATVFYYCAALSLIWAFFWWWATPKKQSSKQVKMSHEISSQVTKYGFWLAIIFVFCLSSAHSLTFSALPLFYVQEVGLPGYAPGTAFSMKTLIEVVAIFSTPFLISRFGLRKSLFLAAMLAVFTTQYLATVQSYPQMLVGAALEGLYYGLYASLGISFVQSFSYGSTARATAMYWNTLIITGVLSGPIVGAIAQVYDFRTVIQVASFVAVSAIIVLFLGAVISRHEPMK